MIIMIIIIIIMINIINMKDLRHVFDKVDRDGNESVNRTELRLALDFLCKQYNIDVKRVTVITVVIIITNALTTHFLYFPILYYVFTISSL